MDSDIFEEQSTWHSEKTSAKCWCDNKKEPALNDVDKNSLHHLAVEPYPLPEWLQ